MFKFIFISLLFLGIFNDSSINNPETLQEHLNCHEYWAAVSFSQFCSLSPANFELSGELDICRLKEGDSYPFDDVVSVLVYNNYSAADASEEYYRIKNEDSGASSFLQMGNIGDDAYAFMNVSGTKFRGAQMEILKGMYTIKIDIKLGYETNCFNEASVQDFARAIVEPL